MRQVYVFTVSIGRASANLLERPALKGSDIWELVCREET
jgi:hypothetical protein